MNISENKTNGTHPNNLISWKEWRKQRKAETKQWKEAKLAKKMKKSDDSLISNEDCIDDKETSSTSGKGRKYTLSIALPGSILDSVHTSELKTSLVGQIARAAVIFNVDEIVIFDEYGLTKDAEEETIMMDKKHRSCAQMARILQFLECPQYLRRYFFPIHKDLTFAGLLHPLNAPHHLRVEDESIYREGVVLDKPVKDGKGSYVYIGLNKTAIIDKALTPKIRVTVELDLEKTSKKHYKGKAVSPLKPCKENGLYWGYSVRLAKTLRATFEESPYKGSYDLIIGTSDKGKSVDEFTVPPFKHLLVAFGGLQGIETCLETDESYDFSDPNLLFHHYLNTCPSQGSRTIRTEEAILVSLSILRPQILQAQQINTSIKS